MTSKKLIALQPGDLVDLVSPGSGSRLEDVELCVNLLQSWGLKVRLPQETFAEHPFHSNEDSVRLKLLKKAMYAKDSKAVWCLRGGYGANRLLPEIKNWKKPERPKLFMGYSDITSLHVWFNLKWKWVTYHGPLLETLISGRLPEEQIEECRQIVFGERKEISFHLKPMNALARKMKSLKAPVIGGNLVVLDCGLGTPYAVKTKGRILVLEEVGERGYRIDRMLEHLAQAGALQGCRAVVFGEFLQGQERDGKNFVEFALDRFAKQSGLPCFAGLEMGHGDFNRVVPLGSRAVLDRSVLRIPTGLSIGDFKR